MRKLRHAVCAAALLGGALAAGAPVQAQPARAAMDRGPPASAVDCDEACLKGYVDQYLAALAAHDPSRLPLAGDVKFTENSRRLKLGDGLWRTISGLGSYRHYFADPAAGEIGFYGTIVENGSPALFTLRLKVEIRKIAEIETLVVRQQQMGAFLKTNQTAPKPIFEAPLGPGDHPTREQLIAAVNPYFDGLNKGNGDMVPFDPLCNRTENGTQTTNNTSGGMSMTPTHPELNIPAMGCRAQFNTRMVTYIQKVEPRRYLVVDTRRGLVFGIFMFQHPGDITQIDVPGVGKVPMMKAALYPFDVEVAELFKVKDGRIREVEAEMVSLPYGSDTGWN